MRPYPRCPLVPRRWSSESPSRLRPQSERSLSRVAAILGRSGLLRLDRACRTSPGLAEDVSRAPDGLSWTVRLREGLRFHDGQPLDAAAAAAAVGAAALSGDVASTPPGLRDVRGLETLDPRTFRIDLRAPSALLPEALASLEVSGGPDGSSGAGPFVLEPEGDRDALALRAFEGFYLGQPAIGRVVLRSYPTARTAWSALMRGEIDALYEVEPAVASFVGASATTQMRTFLRPFVYVMGFNVRRPALRDPGAAANSLQAWTARR